MRLKNQPSFYARVLIAGSLAAVLLAAIGYLGNDLWLASTQWLLVGAILALFAIYFRLD